MAGPWYCIDVEYAPPRRRSEPWQIRVSERCRQCDTFNDVELQYPGASMVGAEVSLDGHALRLLAQPGAGLDRQPANVVGQNYAWDRGVLGRGTAIDASVVVVCLQAPGWFAKEACWNLRELWHSLEIKRIRRAGGAGGAPWPYYVSKRCLTHATFPDLREYYHAHAAEVGDEGSCDGRFRIRWLKAADPPGHPQNAIAQEYLERRAMIGAGTRVYAPVVICIKSHSKFAHRECKRLLARAAQEINPGPREVLTGDDSRKCIICQDWPRQVRLGCGHLLTCRDCCRKLDKCAVCREPICTRPAGGLHGVASGYISSGSSGSYGCAPVGGRRCHFEGSCGCKLPAALSFTCGSCELRLQVCNSCHSVWECPGCHQENTRSDFEPLSARESSREASAGEE